VAHTLAKAASAQIKDSIWLEKVLSFISDIVCRELVVLTFLPLRVFFSGLLMGSDFYGSKKKKKNNLQQKIDKDRRALTLYVLRNS